MLKKGLISLVASVVITGCASNEVEPVNDNSTMADVTPSSTQAYSLWVQPTADIMVIDKLYQSMGRHPILSDTNILYYIGGATGVSASHFIADHSKVLMNSDSEETQKAVIDAQRELVSNTLSMTGADSIVFLHVPNVHMNHYDYKRKAIVLDEPIIFRPKGSFIQHTYDPFNAATVNGDVPLGLKMNYQYAQMAIKEAKNHRVDAFLKVRVAGGGTEAINRLTHLNEPAPGEKRSTIRVPSLKVEVLDYSLLNVQRKNFYPITDSQKGIY